MRLTHVITGLDQGGAEGVLARLLPGLQALGFTQSVISLADGGFYGARIEKLGIPLRTLGMRGSGGMLGGALGLYRALRETQPDVVQTWLYHADLLGLLVGRLAGDAAVVWNVRCAALDRGDVPPTTRWLLRLLARLSARPDAVLFNSAAGLEAHQALGYRPRASKIICNGFDLDDWRPDPARRERLRAEVGVPQETFLVGMVGRFHRMKDHACFLDAAARVRAARPDVRFLLAGTGIDWNNAELVATIDRHGLRDCVVLLGPRGDLPTVMAGLDALALTSTSEGFPNVLGEAMAAGVPCVTTDAGDARSIVGGNGPVVAVGDAAAVANGLLALAGASREQRQALSERCRASIAERFNMNTIVNQYAAFYRELHEDRKHQVR